MEEENKNEFQSFDDEWLTRALRARSQAEARPGLEERILARLATEPESSAQRGWKWMPALAVAFGVLLIVLIGREFLHLGHVPQHERAKVAPDSEAKPAVIPRPNQQTVASAASGPKPKLRALPIRPERPVIARANAQPKLEHFHATSATQQEKLLAAFLKKQGPARLGELIARTGPPEDLTIEPLNIAPIDLGTIPNN